MVNNISHEPEAKKNEVKQLKENFLANISHEIRTPMNIIVGFSNLLADPSYNDEQKKFFIEEINKNSTELLRIIDQIIIAAKIQSKSIEIHKSECRVYHLFEGLYSHFTLDIKKNKKHQINLELEIDDAKSDMTTIVTDSDKLKQAIISLIENALQFTLKGTVTFGYKLQTESIEMFVQDTGIGIEGQDIKHFFKKFYQVKDHPNKTTFGLGIGLSIADDLIHLLGGKLKVETKQGRGTSFYFTLPLN
jgi:signal transduction histidine kinase